jgi:hypothetical protein
MVHIHTNHCCVRSKTLEWFLFTGTTAVRSKTLEQFLYTPITDVFEAKLWNGSYSHQSLMCEKHKSGMILIYRIHYC